MSEPEITATLKNACIHRLGEKSYFTGHIYGDIRRRWADGFYIHTSMVDRVEGDLVYTRNSIYKIDNS